LLRRRERDAAQAENNEANSVCRHKKYRHQKIIRTFVQTADVVSKKRESAGFFMDVSPINGAAPATGSAAASQSRDEILQKAAVAVRFLNSVSDTDREFSVARDPQTQKFVVIVRDRTTGTAIDQFPPEDILKMVSQMNSIKTKGESIE
jgi:uncharacterized FlaG/YvyC family protein